LFTHKALIKIVYGDHGYGNIDKHYLYGYFIQ